MAEGLGKPQSSEEPKLVGEHEWITVMTYSKLSTKYKGTKLCVLLTGSLSKNS